mmetsp:Transcript_2250/g.6695  ORF Transcript_2250/g.6695 Transcript_2250/m.6695 type:complete len:275 (-) Transcript_2250:164-988(-)
MLFSPSLLCHLQPQPRRSVMVGGCDKRDAVRRREKRGRGRKPRIEEGGARRTAENEHLPGRMMKKSKKGECQENRGWRRPPRQDKTRRDKAKSKKRGLAGAALVGVVVGAEDDVGSFFGGLGLFSSEDLAGEVLEGFGDVDVLLGGGFEVLHGVLVGQRARFVRGDLAGLAGQVALAAAETDVDLAALVGLDVVDPVADVRERRTRRDVEANDEAVGLPEKVRRQRPEALLPSSVPNLKLHLLPLHVHELVSVINADRRHVLGRKRILVVANHE